MKSLALRSVANTTQLPPLLYSIKEAARQLAISPSTVRRLIEQGEISSVGQGKLRRVSHEAIVAYINRHRNVEVT